jgi:CRP-like cAMP-binding protein
MSSPEAASIPVFAVLKDKDRERVLQNAKQRTYAPGAVVVREGESSLNLFLVVSGHAHIEHADGRPVARIGPGAFFGELGLIQEHARTATVVADDELTCVLLPAWEFRSLLNEHPEMAVPMLHALIARIHDLTPHQH